MLFNNQLTKSSFKPTKFKEKTYIHILLLIFASFEIHLSLFDVFIKQYRFKPGTR